MLTWPDHALVFVQPHHPLWPVDVDDSFALSIHLQKRNSVTHSQSSSLGKAMATKQKAGC